MNLHKMHLHSAILIFSKNFINTVEYNELSTMFLAIATIEVLISILVIPPALQVTITFK